MLIDLESRFAVNFHIIARSYPLELMEQIAEDKENAFQMLRRTEKSRGLLTGYKDYLCLGHHYRVFFMADPVLFDPRTNVQPMRVVRIRALD